MSFQSILSKFFDIAIKISKEFETLKIHEEVSMRKKQEICLRTYGGYLKQISKLF